MSIADHAAPHAAPRGGEPRPARGGRSPAELVVMSAIRVAGSRTTPDLRRGYFWQWCDGVARTCADRGTFAEYWHQRNERALAANGPLWVALGDSAAQGLGAEHPADGYVGQSHEHLINSTGQPWRVVNLSCSGATIGDVLEQQLPRLATLPDAPALVTCGVGTNDLLRFTPRRIRALLHDLVDAVPDNAVVLDMPLPQGKCRIGRLVVGYVSRANAALHAAAAARGLPVAYVSRHFVPPWEGKFGPDDFHPNSAGYRIWSRALLQAVPQLR